MNSQKTKIRPAIFCEDNRPFWELVRRMMIGLLRMLDDSYGWKTFDR